MLYRGQSMAFVVTYIVTWMRFQTHNPYLSGWLCLLWPLRQPQAQRDNESDNTGNMKGKKLGE